MNIKFLTILGIIFLLFSCENTTDPNKSDPELAATYLDSAMISLENTMYQIINDDNLQPEDVDFSETYRLYKLAYENDSNNLDANFGLALTNFLIINQEEKTNQLFDEWMNFFEETSGSFNKSTTAKKSSFPNSIKTFVIPGKEFVRGMINLPKAALVDPPKISDIQEYVENTIIPKLDFAISALDKIDDHSDYTFMVSPRMQGVDEADSVEIDLGEIYAIEVVLNTLNTFANMTIAYNVDMWSYDSLEAIQAFSKGGAFLKLRSGNNPMKKVKNSFFTALDKIAAGLFFIFNETDPQDDDLIKPDGLTLDDVNQMSEMVTEIKNTISTPQKYTDDWDDNPATPEETITIDFSKIFDNPINDLKSVLPNYSITVQPVDFFGDRWIEDHEEVRVQFSAPDAGYYYYYRYYEWAKDGYEYDPGASTNLGSENGFNSAFENTKGNFMKNSEITELNMRLEWNATLEAGQHSRIATIYYKYSLPSNLSPVYLPESLEWDAQTFSDWEFKNPTLNGLLPAMTDPEFKHIFGITEEDWKSF